jgi:hypothetical protein
MNGAAQIASRRARRRGADGERDLARVLSAVLHTDGAGPATGRRRVWRSEPGEAGT